MGLQQWMCNFDTSICGFMSIVKWGTAPDPVIDSGRLKVYGSFANGSASGIDMLSSVHNALMSSRMWIAHVRASGIGGSGNFHVWRVDAGTYDNRAWYFYQSGNNTLVVASWSSSEGEVIRGTWSNSVTTPVLAVIVCDNVGKKLAFAAFNESTGSTIMSYLVSFSSSSHQSIFITVRNYTGYTATGGAYFDDLHVVVIA